MGCVAGLGDPTKGSPQRHLERLCVRKLRTHSRNLLIQSSGDVAA